MTLTLPANRRTGHVIVGLDRLTSPRWRGKTSSGRAVADRTLGRRFSHDAAISDPVYLYTDDVIAILPERNLNNGQPSLHAALIAAAAPQPGEHVVHVGAGVGYYRRFSRSWSASRGRVTAIEFDAELAARATANLAQTPHVRAIHGDDTRLMFEPTDIIYVNAGATRSADAWLGFP